MIKKSAAVVGHLKTLKVLVFKINFKALSFMYMLYQNLAFFYSKYLFECFWKPFQVIYNDSQVNLVVFRQFFGVRALKILTITRQKIIDKLMLPGHLDIVL